MDTSKLTIDLGDGLWLRSPRHEDAGRIFTLVSRNYEHLRTFMEWVKVDYSENDAREWLDRSVGDPDAINFLICRNDDLLGAIGFASFDYGAKVTEIGYWIDADEQGKGIVSRACTRLVEFGFKDLAMNRIQIRCADANVRSSAIPERLGFKLEGIQRQHVMRDGKVYDFMIYGLLRNEWEERNA